MTVRVLVDAWHLGGASANRGIGTYMRELLPLLAREPELDVVAIAERTTTLPAGVRHHAIARHAPSRWAQREHDIRLSHDLARAARTSKADLIFSPADNPPRRSPRPWVQMLHDLIPLVVEAELFEAPARRWRHVGRRLRHAEIVCTNSWCTAVDAVRLFGVEEERIRVIPLGVGSHFQPPGSRARPHPPTVLYVGEYGPHKGFAEAFAVAGLIAEAGLPHDLEMASYLAPWYESIVRELLAHAPRPDRVKLLGYVDDIAPAYQRADALIVTSRYEGFCLPALEAMACGTPVVAFSNSAISEVVSGGGVLVPDGDVAALATALVDTLNDQVRWKEISDRGIEHARAFSWSRCAGAHADVFRAVAAGCR